MRQNSLVLETYIQLIQQRGSILAELGSIRYYILFQTVVDGMINVPEEMEWVASGDNRGNFIVTAWACLKTCNKWDYALISDGDLDGL